MSNDGGSTALVVVLGVVLLLFLGAANVAYAADRTVLDSEYVVETMDDEDAFATMTVELREELLADINQNIETQIRGEFEVELPVQDPALEEELDDIDQEAIIVRLIEEELDPEAYVQAAITEEFVRGEVARNVENFYAYLHGETDELRLWVNLAEPRDTIVDAIASESVSRERILEIALEEGATPEIAELIADEAEPEINDRLDAIANELRNEIPDEESLSEDDEAEEELEPAQDAFGLVGTLLWVLPLGALVIVGGLYAYTRSPHRTANTVGAALAVAGLIGLLIGIGIGETAMNLAESALEEEEPGEAEEIFDALLAAIDGFFDVVVTQSLLLTVAGLGLVGAVYADRNGYFDSVKGGSGGESSGLPPSNNQFQQERGPDRGYDQQAQYREEPHRERYDQRQYQQTQERRAPPTEESETFSDERSDDEER